METVLYIFFKDLIFCSDFFFTYILHLASDSTMLFGYFEKSRFDHESRIFRLPKSQQLFDKMYTIWLNIPLTSPFSSKTNNLWFFAIFFGFQSKLTSRQISFLLFIWKSNKFWTKGSFYDFFHCNLSSLWLNKNKLMQHRSDDSSELSHYLGFISSFIAQQTHGKNDKTKRIWMKCVERRKWS